MSFDCTSHRRWLLVVAALAALVGCRTSGRAESNPAVAASGAGVETGQEIVRASATTTKGPPPQIVNVNSAGKPGVYTISLATFIPHNYVLAPAIHPQSYTGVVPQRLVFAGDDRTFDVDATRYRAKQVVTLVPDEALDADGLYDDSKLNLGGRTESFIAKTALADGKLDERDRVTKEDDRLGPKSLHEQVAVDVSGMLIDDPVRLGPKRVSIRLHTAKSGGPRDQLIAGAPSIDWDFTIIIDTSGATPKYELAGTWDGYPAMEIYINRQPIYQYRGEDRSPTMSDLMKLVPKYGDLTVEKSGTLSRLVR